VVSNVDQAVQGDVGDAMAVLSMCSHMMDYFNIAGDGVTRWTCK
jgi:cytochrome c oxidase subunit IV